MLLSKSESGPAKVAMIVTRNARVKTLLAGVLADWGFADVEDSYAAKVVFVERGLPAPPGHYPHLVWLTPMPVDGGHSLVTPISLVELFHLLEEELFPSPRRHIRVSVDCTADLQVDGAWSEARLISLSDRGGRLVCERELPRKQTLNVEVKLAGRTLRLPAEVLYCVPPGDTSGREKPQIGVLFSPIDPRLCAALREYIELACLTRICQRNDIGNNDPALSWFAINHDPWSNLA